MSTPIELMQQALEAFDEQISSLAGQRDELSSQIDALMVQRDQVAGLLEQLGKGVPPAAPSGRTAGGTPTKPRPAGSTPARPAKAGPSPTRADGRRSPRTCPKCGKVCTGGTGLSAHMRSAHPAGLAAAKPTPPPSPPEGRPDTGRAAATAPSSSPGGRFRCSDCTAEFLNVDRLSDHVFKDHNMRPLTDAEKAGKGGTP